MDDLFRPEPERRPQDQTAERRSRRGLAARGKIDAALIPEKGIYQVPGLPPDYHIRGPRIKQAGRNVKEARLSEIVCSGGVIPHGNGQNQGSTFRGVDGNGPQSSRPLEYQAPGLHR